MHSEYRLPGGFSLATATRRDVRSIICSRYPTTAGSSCFSMMTSTGRHAPAVESAKDSRPIQMSVLSVYKGRRASRLKGSGRIALMSAAQLALCLSLIADIPAQHASKIEASAQKALDTLPGRTGFAFTELTERGPHLLYGVRAHERFAIGSSFKLYIFGTLVEEVNNGRRRLDDTMLLRADKIGPPHSEMAD